MSEESERNASLNAAANTRVYHADLTDLPPHLVRKMYRGGIRSGEPLRTPAQAAEMLNKVPPSQRSGIDSHSAGTNLQDYLADKHASHVKPHSQGGSNKPNNLRWENAKDNLARSDRPMSGPEQVKLGAQWQLDNLTGAVKAGVKAAPMGAAVGAVTTAPVSLLRNALRVVRGEISATEAVAETLKETTVGGVVGGAAAFSTTTIAAACPPIAIALTTVAPALLVAGSVGLVYEFFKVLDDHKQAVRAYYQSLTRQELQRLQEIEDELIEQHNRNLEFLAEAKAINDYLTNRPCEPGIEGAMKQYLKSVALAQSLGATSTNHSVLHPSQAKLLPPEI